MIQLKNISKTYRRGKTEIKALRDVSLSFGKKGMVFIHGKSGSGKTTLLNVLGGLDDFDGGEILVDGREMSAFKSTDYDSYRLDYVGFVFQSYSLLEGFDVNDNIALASELKGRKADQSRIDEVLSEVDLEGFGNRKPNELSGGQQQRAAIARALIKDPRMILADEPTGALDEETGEGILALLKKESEKRLVIVVSHDEDSARRYADRIIRLKDGRVVSDTGHPAEDSDDNKEMDVNSNIEGNDSGNEVLTESADAKPRLPIKRAGRMALLNLKNRPVRLVFSLLISIISLTMFATADTLGSVDETKVASQSIVDSDYPVLTVRKTIGKRLDQFADTGTEVNCSQKEIDELNRETGFDFVGYVDADLEYSSRIRESKSISDCLVTYSRLIAPADDGLKLLGGTLPKDGNELLITDYQFETFYQYGYYYVDEDFNVTEIAAREVTFENIVGKNLAYDYSIAGVVDTDFDTERYRELLAQDDGRTMSERINVEMPYLADLVKYSNINAVYMSEDGIERYKEKYFAYRPVGTYVGFSSDKYFLYNPDIPVYFFDKNHADELTGYEFVNQSGVPVEFDGSTLKELGLAFKQEDYQYFSSEEQVALDTFAPIQSDDYIYLVYQVALRKTTIDLTDSFKDTTIYNYIYNQQFDGQDKENKETIQSALNYYLNMYNLDTIPDNIYFNTFYENLHAYCDKYIAPNQDILFANNNKDSFYSYFDNSMVEATCVGLLLPTPLKNDARIRYSLDLALSVSGNESKDNMYAFGYTSSFKNYSNLSRLVSSSLQKDKDDTFKIIHPVMEDIDALQGPLVQIRQVCFYISLPFLVLTILIFLNYVSMSINDKKHDIGIIYSLGGGKKEVFKIYGLSSFMVSFIEFVPSCFILYLVCFLVNNILKNKGLTSLSFLVPGIRQIVLIFLLAVCLSFIASLIPIIRYSRKKPIELIRQER